MTSRSAASPSRLLSERGAVNLDALHRHRPGARHRVGHGGLDLRDTCSGKTDEERSGEHGSSTCRHRQKCVLNNVTLTRQARGAQVLRTLDGAEPSFHEHSQFS